MRVALIAGTYQPDRCGVAHYTAHLRQTLAQRQVETLVFTTHAAATAVQDPSVVGTVADWHWQALPALSRAIVESNPDLLHIQHAAGTYGFDRSIFLLPLWLRLVGYHRPIVTTLHEYGWWEWQPQWLPAAWVESLKQWGQHHGWWDREDGFLITQSNAVITTNQEAQRVVAARLPQLADRVQRIPIGANVAIAPAAPNARSQLRHQHHWADDSLVIAFFGFLHPVKGLESLFHAFQTVIAQSPQARLLVIGGVESLALPEQQATAYWDRLVALIEQLNLTNTVRLTGYLDAAAVSQQLAGADIGVLPFNHGVTLKSGSLLALMAHRLAIVATRSSPPDPELDHDWLTWVMPRQPAELAAALLRLLADPSLRQRQGNAAYDFSRAFDWNPIADRHLAIYQTVLNPLASLAREEE